MDLQWGGVWRSSQQIEGKIHVLIVISPGSAICHVHHMACDKYCISAVIVHQSIANFGISVRQQCALLHGTNSPHSKRSEHCLFLH